MIIALKGTNGAGKSTIVRNLMDTFEYRREVLVEGRRKPIGYVCGDEPDNMSLFVVGHYEIANGGVDTLPDLDTAYALIAKHDAAGRDVIYEGKNMSDGVNRICQFPAERIRIIVVDHPVPMCVQAVRDRGHKIKSETIINIAGKVTKEAKILQSKGYLVSVLSRQDAYSACRRILHGRKEWIGVDFDDTLRVANGPNAAMVRRVKQWLAQGYEVRVVTARLSPIEHDAHDIERHREVIEAWCEHHIGIRLPCQWGKSSGMIELYDDKARRF